MLIKPRREARPTSAQGGEHRPRVESTRDGPVLQCVLSGMWNTRTVALVDAEIRALHERTDFEVLRLDISGVRQLDTAGAWLIERLVTVQTDRGAKVEVSGSSQAASILLPAVEDAAREVDRVEPPPRRSLLIGALEAIGRNIVASRHDFVSAMHILGATIRGAQMKLGRRHAINPASIVAQIHHIGVGAIPVVLLMSAIVGAIVAQQGAFQLRYFGAEIFVVDLVSILILRELGVLMTAIMVAGRSGSAVTAEIGSMKMREEVDALTVMGLNPVGVLVFPRLVALVIAVPCLTVIANFAALCGAMGVAYYYSGIAPEAFIDRLRASIDLSTVFAGLIKAPFMALIIGVLASVEGMKVGGSAESLGQRVTASVVKAIFIVIVVDGLFAMFYAAIDF